MDTSNRALRYVLGAQLLLPLPLIGTIVSDSFEWGLLDFALVSVLLAGFGFAFSFIMNKSASPKQLSFGLVLAAVIFLIYAELAVGIFGSPIAGN